MIVIDVRMGLLLIIRRPEDLPEQVAEAYRAMLGTTGNLQTGRCLMASKVLVINKNSQIRGVVCAAFERNGFVTVGGWQLS